MDPAEEAPPAAEPEPAPAPQEPAPAPKKAIQGSHVYMPGPWDEPDPALLGPTDEEDEADAEVEAVEEGIHFDAYPGWWQVREDGVPMTTRQFAETVGDSATLERMDAELEEARRRARLLAGVGGGLVLLAGVPLAFQPEDRGPQAASYAVNQGDYATEDEYRLAQASADAAYEEALAGYQYDLDTRREDRIWSAVALAGTGAMTLFAAPYARIGVERRQEDPSNYYSAEEAQEWLAGVAAAPPPPRLELRAAVTPGWIGVQGRF